MAMATLCIPSTLIGNAIGQVYYQRAAANWADHVSIAPLWKSTARNLLLFGVPIYAVIALLSPYAYPFLFGEAWVLSGTMAQMLSVATCFSFASSPLDRTCLVVGAWWYPIFWHTFRASSALAVAMAAWKMAWSVQVFILAQAAILGMAYITDLIMGWRFSRMVPRCAIHNQSPEPCLGGC